MKKLLSAIILAAMLCSALAGCSSESSEAEGSQADSEAAAETVAAETTADSYADSSDKDFDWQKVFSSCYSTDSPYYVLLPEACRGYSEVSGTYSMPIDNKSVVMIVDSGNEFTAEDFNLDLSAVKELEDILPCMEYTFDRLAATGVNEMRDEKEPYFTTESTEKMQVKAEKKTYDVLKTYGTYHYMTRDLGTSDPQYEKTASFIAYSTFLEDGMPFYCAAVDVSENQDAKEACETRALQLMQGLAEVPASFFGY